jgi:hypothetical protein
VALDQWPEQLSMWVLAAGMAVAIVPAAWTEMSRPLPRATLPWRGQAASPDQAR